MTTRIPENVPFLYLAEIDLFRIGNSESPRLDRVRAVDIDTYDRNGIRMVRANGKGISVFTEADLSRARFEGWVWKIPHGTQMPLGLGLINDHGGHFMICPISDMPLDEYKALLSKLALLCERVRKMPGR